MSAITRSSGFIAPSVDASVRRDRLVKELGYTQLDCFERWAFSAKSPVIYDNRIIFLWECAHSTKEKFNDSDVDGALKVMIDLFKNRFTMSEGFYSDY